MKNTEIIKKNYEFKKVFSKGKYYKGNVLDIFYKDSRQKKNRIGVAVSKKAGKSFFRNRVKRLIRENYRLLEKEIKTGYSFIFVWKKTNLKEKATFINIKKDMEKFFLKNKFLKEKNEESTDISNK